MLSITVALHSYAQDPATAAKQAAQKSIDALLSGDYAQVVESMPKRVVAAMGGKEAALAMLKQQTSEKSAQGISFQSDTIGTPQPMQKIGAWLVTLVPQTVTLKVRGGHLVSDAYLIGISEDEGKSWSFVDSAAFAKGKEALLAQVLPELAGKLRIPETKRAFKAE